MRKVGTISSAAGLIFYGIWMIIKQNDKLLASEVFKWWPVLFIIIGIEILILLGIKDTDKKVGFNPLIIFIIIIFLCTNIFIGVKDHVNNFVSNNKIDTSNLNIKNIFENLDLNYNKVDVNKEIQFNGNKINVEVNNGVINVKKSEDGNIKIKGKVSIDSDNKNVEINPKILDKECSINFNDDIIKTVNIDLYIPSNVQIKIDSDNLKLDSVDESLKADYIINGDNGTVQIKGDAEKIAVKINNGIINIKNKLSKDVNVEIDNGTVNLKTEDKNADIKVDIDAGVCSVNKSRIVNSGMNKIYGDGTSKIKINASHGTVDVDSQE